MRLWPQNSHTEWVHFYLILYFPVRCQDIPPEFECLPNPSEEGKCLSGRYAYQYNCSFYVTCFTTCQFRLDQCEEGKEFNAEYWECVDPSLSNCNGEQSPPLTPSLPITFKSSSIANLHKEWIVGSIHGISFRCIVIFNSQIAHMIEWKRINTETKFQRNSGVFHMYNT